MTGQSKRHATIGGRVRQARLDAGARRGQSLTQSEVAAALGVTPATVSQWESGGTEPTLRIIPRLADVLGVGAGWLAFGAETTEPADQGGLDDVDVGAVLLTPAQLERAEEAVAAREAAARLASQRVRGARQPGKKAR